MSSSRFPYNRQILVPLIMDGLKEYGMRLLLSAVGIALMFAVFHAFNRVDISTQQTQFEHQVQDYTEQANNRALNLSEELLSRFMTSNEFAQMMSERNSNMPVTTQLNGFLDYYKELTRIRNMQYREQVAHSHKPPIKQLTSFDQPLHQLNGFNTHPRLDRKEDFIEMKDQFEDVMTEIEALLATLPPGPLEDTAETEDTGLPRLEDDEHAPGGGL